MGKKYIRRPHEIVAGKPLFVKAFRPGILGCMTAGVLALFPRNSLLAVPFLDRARAVPALNSRPILALIGFILGFGLAKGLEWTRLQALRKLLAYHGWITAPKSLKTKVWGILLKIMKGPGPYSTFEFQDLIPHQPLPTLDNTLDRWLEASKHLVNEEEYLSTKKAVEDLRRNEGPVLQKHLEKRAAREHSWLHEYWTKAAYLASREPLPIHSNFCSVFNLDKSIKTSMSSRAANIIRLAAEYLVLIEAEQVPPIELQDLIPLCMNGHKNLLNSSRRPADGCDEFEVFPGGRHFVVLRNNQYFVLEATAEDSSGKNKTLLTVPELKMQIERILELAKDTQEACEVAALTTQRRDIWAKQYKILAKKNEATLRLLESSILIVCLDDYIPKSGSDVCRRCLAGTGSDRWFDKNVHMVLFGDGQFGGNAEHSGFDGTVTGNFLMYMCHYEKYTRSGDIFDNGGATRNLPAPKRLRWDVSELKEAIEVSLVSHRKQAADLEFELRTAPYGKGVIKKFRVSPDGFIQMALHLTFYRLEGRLPKSYEPATSRLFAFGRTETIHIVSSFCKSWIQAMEDPHALPETKRALLKQAVNFQTAAKTQCTLGQGCDRHLLGLYIASRELGMDVPQLFMDKSWQDPFELSTSQTPTEFHIYGTNLDYTETLGAFGPYRKDIVGAMYMLHGDDIINIAFTVFKSSGLKNVMEYSDEFAKVMNEMKALFP